jgi:hypothetical protein
MRLRFERHAPAQRLVEDTRAGYDPGSLKPAPFTVRDVTSNLKVKSKKP